MKVQRAILEALDSTDPHVMPEVTVWSDVRLRVSPAPSLAEVQRELQALQIKTEIVGVRDDDRGMCYKLTANGKARLAS